MAIIRYAIVDDHKIFRQGLRYALADDHKLKLVGEAENGMALMQLIEKQKPDVVLLDIKMPEMDGFAATKIIRSGHPGIKILMLTTFDEENFILHLLELGINGFLLKNAEPDEIKKAIHHVFENDYYFNDLVSKAMLKTITHNNSDKLKFKAARLNDRETEILRLICQELTTTEIAAKIFLSPRTVEGIRTELLEKTGVRNTAGLVVYALKNDIYTM